MASINAAVVFFYSIFGFFCMSYADEWNSVTLHKQVMTLKAAKLRNSLMVPGESELPVSNFEANLLTQPLNHSQPSLGTFQQRYWVNSNYWRSPDGPVFLFIGGESALDDTAVSAGHHVEMAKTYNALLLAVEHRFYGESINGDGVVLENLKYLTIPQALADLATFHAYAVNKWTLSSSNTWICFGGSYPGTLSSYFRLKYPDLVYAAVASSATVLPELNYEGYMKKVANSFKQTSVGGSSKCLKTITSAFQEIDRLLNEQEYFKLYLDFSTCDMFESSLDAFTFVNSLTAKYMLAAQYNDQGGIDISSICDYLEKASFEPTPYDQLRVLHNAIMKAEKWSCISNSWTKFVDLLRRTDKDLWGGVYGSRQWTYQKCSEFGHFETCNKHDSCPFSQYLTLETNLKQCAEIFELNSVDIKRDIQSTLVYNGGTHPNGSRIIYVNGLVDPLRGLSVLKTIKPSLPAILITDASHCQDMHATDDDDSKYLTSARLKISKQIKAWLDEAKMPNTATTRAPTDVNTKGFTYKGKQGIVMKTDGGIAGVTFRRATTTTAPRRNTTVALQVQHAAGSGTTSAVNTLLCMLCALITCFNMNSHI